jgi:hypothetical protein
VFRRSRFLLPCPPQAGLLLPSFRLSPRNDIVHRVRLSATTRAKITVIPFVLLTVLYGCICSAACTLGACPTETQNAATHDCDHSSSVPAQHQSPQNPDCPTHHHPTFDAVKSDALSQSQFTDANRATAAQLLPVTLRSAAFAAPSHSLFSDLAPPPDLNFPLHQKISVLRI